MLGDISLRKINTNSEKPRLPNKKIFTNKNLKQACVSSSRIITTSKYRKQKDKKHFKFRIFYFS